MKDLEIQDAKKVSGKDIKKKILTGETSWIPFSRKQRFDADIWRTDLRRIERYYREMGYYQAIVSEDEVIDSGKDEVKLRVKVIEGEPTIIDSFEVNGLQDLPEMDRALVLKDLPLKKGDIFVEAKWESLKTVIEGRLRERGYAVAKVDGKAELDLVERKVKIPLSVTPGPRFHFGEIEVTTGEKPRVESWRVKEKAARIIEPGRTYSEEDKDEAQSRVFQMGVFGAAQVKNGVPDVSKAEMPIIVDVREAPFNAVRVGFGLGFDQARNEARVIGEWTDRDFLGSLRRLNLRAVAGYAFIPSAYQVLAGGDGLPRHGPIARLSAELEQPRVFHPDVKANVRAELERRLEPAYSYFGSRNRVGLVWQPTPAISVFPSYNLEAYRLDRGEVDLAGRAPALLFGCPQTCVLSYLEQFVEYDKRDDKQEPKKGYYVAISFQEGGGFLGGSFSYLRVLPEVRAYVTPDDEEKFTIAGKLKAGTLQPTSGNASDSPIVSRFFSGGGNQMRGFSSRRLSPMLVIDTPTRDERFQGQPLPIGGNGLIETSLELRYNAFGNLVFATFFDTGLVTSAALRPTRVAETLEALQLAVGGGVRYRTPIGPIRLDLAYRPNIGKPLEVYQVGDASLTYPSATGCFGIGGRNGTRAGSPEGPCALHISIGEAF